MGPLPSGTVTVLFTDIEGSTRLWEERREDMPSLLARHDDALRAAVECRGGHVVKSTGDGMIAVFAGAAAAVDAATEAQATLGKEALPPVRMAVHTGDVVERDGDYFGPTLNRAARLMGIGHGGQVLVSGTTRRLLESGEFLDLGPHRLRDLSEPEHVFQLVAPGLPSDFPPLRSLDTFPTNLPVQLTSFVGREEELVAVAELLQHSRIVTITGVGGVGKTRLALAAASEAVEVFRDGVWLVELETLSDEERLVDVVAATLSVHTRPPMPTLSALLNELAAKRALIVLDNCEHVVGAAARLATAIARGAPEVAILATSREPLGAQGEAVFPVQPLDTGEAVRLFHERAIAAGAGPGAAAETEEVARVCRGLDGIPLAIELAAARLRTLSASELARRLDHRFRLLTGGRAAVDRHQTLRATIDWSYQLLNPVERTVLARLSVFAGGCSVDAAEAVIASDDLDALDVVDALTSLADKSLAVVDHTSAGTRYRLLETIRAYAAERLVEGGDADVARHRHAQYFQRLARAAARGLFSPDEVRWAASVEPEIENLRAAVEWAVEEADTDTAMSIAASFVRQGIERPSWGTASMAELALAAPGAMAHDLRGRVLGEAALSAFRRGDTDTGDRRLREAMQAMRDGARFSAAPWSYLMPTFEFNDETLTLIQEGLAMASAANDRFSETGMRATLAILRMSSGDIAGALAQADRAVADAEELGRPGLLASALGVRAHVRYENGDIAGTRADARRGLELAPVREITTETTALYSAYALTAADVGEPRRAIEAYRRILSHARSLGDPHHAGLLLRNGAAVYNAAGRHDLTIMFAAVVRRLVTMLRVPTVRRAVESAKRVVPAAEVERLEAEAERLDLWEALDMAITWIDEELARPERDPGTR